MKIPQLVVPAPAAWSKDRGGRVDGASPEKGLEALRNASVQFEALLYKEMLHAMVQGSTEGGFFGEGTGKETWEGLFESGMSDALAGKGGLGMADQIYKQFASVIRSQAAAPSELPASRTRVAGPPLDGSRVQPDSAIASDGSRRYRTILAD